MQAVPEGLFLLNLKNHDFVHGRTTVPVSENPLPMLMLKLGFLAFIIIFIVSWMFRVVTTVPTLTLGWPTMVVVVLALFLCYVTYGMVKPILIDRKFQRGCGVLFGELTHCQRVDDDGTIDWRVKYRFQSPHGGMVEGQSSTEGTAVKVENRPDPPLGVGVAIAYLNDQTHRML
jgi:hypothetical protein